jgi:hypothetical protein
MRYLKAMELLASLESTGFSTWMRESGFAFFSTLIAHALGMGFLVGVHVVIDLRVLGFGPGVPIPILGRFRPVASTALAVTAASGVLLLVAYPTKAITNPVFYAKLAAVAGALLAGRSLSRLTSQDAGPDAEVVPAALRARGLAAASLALWVLAITSGRFLAYTYRVLMAADVL